MRRFYVPEDQIKGDELYITGSDYNHLTKVLRIKTGTNLQLTDGKGNIIKSVVKDIQNERIVLEKLETIKDIERKIFIRLYQAIPKGDRFEYIIEKMCELGVDEIIPLITKRTIPKYEEQKSLKKRTRWEKIALETMKQIGRTSSMSIKSAIYFKEIEKYLQKDTVKIVPWECEEDTTIKDYLRKKKNIEKIEIIIGPEGGFGLDEILELQKLDFFPVSLGKRVLKTDTAAISAISCIYYELDL